MSGAETVALEIGAVRVTAIADAEVDFVRDFDELYPSTAKDAWEVWRERHPETFAAPLQPRFPYTCYLVQRDGVNLLVDAGMGPADAVIDPASFGGMRTTQQLVDGLARCGVAPEDVDVVLFTHLDFDHVGWSVVTGEDGVARPTFAGAEHVVHAAEWAAFTSPGWDLLAPYDHLAVKLGPLEHAVRLHLIEGDDEAILPGVQAFRTPGHTPGHLSVRIADGDAVAYVAGDVWVHPAQVANPDWQTLTDRDVEQARATRRAFAEGVLDTGALVSAAHFPAPCFGQIATVGGEPRWVPLEDGATGGPRR